MEVKQKYDTENQITTNPSDELSELDQCVLNIVRKEGYLAYDITKKQLNHDGGNYLGILSEIDIKGKTNEGQKTTSIFVKALPRHQVDFGASLHEIYEREKFVYLELSKIYVELQNEAAIPVEKRFKIAKCFDESNVKALFLENLARKSFKTVYRMDVITLNYAEECIKQLARYHGLSFALEKKRSNYFNNVIKPMKFATKPGRGHDELCDSVYKTVLKQLDCCTRDRLEHKLRLYLDKFLDYIYDEETLYCFCHGDYRPNNVLFKETNGRVTEVIPVDYQFAYYGCPVLDLIYFIYTGTDHEFRKQHLPYLKDLYYESLTDFLNYFNISVDSVFSRTRYDELYESRKDFGLTTIMLLGPLLFADENSTDRLINEESEESVVTVEERFKDRLYGVIKEFIDT